ncbi:hypothetical protein NPIL_76981 [Nephila pilipes]|uniref:Uncharacterized protein n=1 Tax=Nephila pilipes TaxID=299642 RepID=A0A8X6IHF7_NEPPI|nr:hypothetical protein NPIL_76981 [Nephila pilipes]
MYTPTNIFTFPIVKKKLFLEAEANDRPVPIQPSEAAKECFSDRTKDSEHGEEISYVHLHNAPENPDVPNTTPKDSGPGRRVSVDLSTVNGRVFETKYKTNKKRKLIRNIKLIL